MGYPEHLNNTDWNPWLKDKSKKVVLGLARGLQDVSGSDPSPNLREALYNACKMYVHAVEMETQKDLGDAHSDFCNQIFDFPERAEGLLAAFEATAATVAEK